MSEVDETTEGSDIDASPEMQPDENRSSISRALDALTELEATPLADHPDVYQHIHTTLHDALTEIDGS